MKDDVAHVLYLVQGTTQELEISGGHISVQMDDPGTAILVASGRYRRPRELHLFRHAQYVKVVRGDQD